MQLNNDGIKLMELWKRLESKKSQDDLLFQAETMVRAQEAFKADYGLTKSEAPDFFRPDSGKPAA